MSTIFLKLLNLSITASWLILAVLGLRLLLKKAPKWQVCLLWSAVAIRLIFPFSIKTSLSLIPSAQTISPDILYMPKPEIHSGIPVLNSLVNPVIQGSLSATPTASANPLQIWTELAALVWLAGMIILFLYAGISYGRLSRRVKASLQLEEGVWICDD
ncbi:MAG: transcriptional regulator, partial [Clostridiaceae bacterium]|nr:transcriptional regulator [Clostridiaceae bacterium]